MSSLTSSKTLAVILKSERKGWKAKCFLAFIYFVLILGALTMVYPFMVMLSDSISTSYDYSRHEPVLRSLFDESDRYMRFVSVHFRKFPHEVFPEAPESWTTWDVVAKDREGIAAFYRREQKFFQEHEDKRSDLIASLLRLESSELSCEYDPRDVPRFLKKKYGTVEEMNKHWPVPYRTFFDVSFNREYHGRGTGVKRSDWEEFVVSYLHGAAERGDYICRTLPRRIGDYSAAIRLAMMQQFREYGWRDYFKGAFANYSLVADYLFIRGRAFANTIILVLLTILASLTVNPMAAYALSRFHLAGTGKILLFMLATMAFPTAVTAIPGFLLIRELGLLNTFAALVLPSVANGMSIFILKGFFDALPRELYEAATIDGAGEWTVFSKITLPMTLPILAVNALNSFIHAYSSWEWAFLVCQEESHWTLSVWMYQLSQVMANQPWCVMAGFVLISIPTAVVFLLCQKVIMRGIVLPSLK